MTSITGAVIATMIGACLTAGLMTLLQLSGAALPVVFILVLAVVAWGLGRLDVDWRQPRLEGWEKALIGFAAAVALLRLGPYAYQYIAGVLVAPITWDDNWHFQEVASLVNAERFPPRLNFKPDSYFHFYYVPWVPTAALGSLLQSVTGMAMIKLVYALGALGLCLAIAWVLIVAIRHLVPPAGRPWAMAALMIAGAAVDGLFAIRHFVVLGHPLHAEWWQNGLLIANSFSALSTSLIWVPHHLTGAMAVLLALVVATEPMTLALRSGRVPFVLAGLLMAVAAFSSVFAFIGGVLALFPLVWELARSKDKSRLGWLALGFIVPALPLAYIYLGSDARGGIVIGQAFTAWTGQTGKAGMGLFGVLLAFLLMVLEVGWLFIIGKGLDRGGEDGAPMRSVAVAAALVLASTAFIGFSGSNNWALRATIVPVVLLAAYVGRGFAAGNGAVARLDPAVTSKAGAAALCLAGVAHLNEVALLVGASARSPAYASETAECKAAILRANLPYETSGPSPTPGICRDKLSPYHIERPFKKAMITPEDRELMGRGFGFLGGGGNPSPK